MRSAHGCGTIDSALVGLDVVNQEQHKLLDKVYRGIEDECE